MKRGFSLIELLIVVAMLATLTGGTLIAFGDTFAYAEENTRRHNRQTIRKAIDDFNADHGRYPRGLRELVDERYLREIPLDPVTGSWESWVSVPSAPGRQDVYDVAPPVAGEGDTR